MKILIDGLNLALTEGTGVATYARNLSYALRGLNHEIGVLYGLPLPPPRDALLGEIGFFDPEGVGNRNSRLARAKRIFRKLSFPFGYGAHRIPHSGRVDSRALNARLPAFDTLWNVEDLFQIADSVFKLTGRFAQVRLPWQTDIVHWTYPVPIRVSGARNIYTIHDVVPLRLPFTTLDDKRFYFRLVKAIARTADHIVTVSEHSRTDIANILDDHSVPITNTYQATSLPEDLVAADKDKVASEIRGLAGLEYQGYFLFWGAIEPKKNVGRLIEAYLGADTKTPLVLVGPKAWLAEDELRLVASSQSRARTGRIIRLNYLPFRNLVTLIRGAKAVLFPSLYEGFGLPILEAMICGASILTSTEASCPEIAGTAALLADPYDVDAIRDGIGKLDTDADLRRSLGSAGQARAKEFSEETYRVRLTHLYEDVMSRPAR